MLGMHREIEGIKQERRSMYGAGHMVAAFIGALVGILGQPLRPG